MKNQISKHRSLLLTAFLTLLTFGTVSAANSTLNHEDMVGVSFWLASAMMLASTVFFIMERNNVADKWKTSMTVAALVTGVAWYHYTYMRDHWANSYAAVAEDGTTGVGDSPLVLRYIDWLITVPLQVSEFYLILAAVGVVSAALFWKLFGASIIMLVAGFLGEAGHANAELMLAIGVAAWLYIIYEIWAGDAKKSAETASEGTQFAFKAMALILTVGWAIYPIGYFFGNVLDNVDIDALNILYNVADVVNKTAFGMMVWYAATMDTKASSSEE